MNDKDRYAALRERIAVAESKNAASRARVERECKLREDACAARNIAERARIEQECQQRGVDVMQKESKALFTKAHPELVGMS